MDSIRWAIVGTGFISTRFAQGMRAVRDAELAAVVSRTAEAARAFSDRFGGSCYTDIAAMLQEARPDIVYLGIPNDRHFPYLMQILEAGVPVLSEKPIVDNRRQLDQVIAAAQKKDLFLMEGMWTRCFPAVQKARHWIEEGRIGRPLSLFCSFDIQPDYADWQPWKAGISHAGGALRDVGIYTLGMAWLTFGGGPESHTVYMTKNDEVDISAKMLLSYGGGRTAFLSASFNQISRPETEIVGEAGRILIGPEFWDPTTAVLLGTDGSSETFTMPFEETGFQYEIMEVQRCLRAGEKESPLFPLRETMEIADLIEQIRKEQGILYAADSDA